MEETFERYEEDLRGLLAEARVRARLSALFEPGPAHEELRRAYADVSKEAARVRPDIDEWGVLQTLRDCEEAAHEFYVHQLDLLSDPRLVALFRKLRDEEATHIHAIDEAREILQGATTRHIEAWLAQ